MKPARTRLAAALLIAHAAAFAAIDGTVVNRTTGKPQAGATVTLVDLRKGMSPAATTSSDAQGRFRIDQPLMGPALLQATWEGVGYNLMLQPGAPSSGLEVPVYNSSSRPGTAAITQDMILLEPADKRIQVREGFIFNNPGKLTYNDTANGTLRFYLPPEAGGEVKVTVQSMGLPIERSAEKTGQDHIYRVNYPIRPGETQFEVAYTIPAAGKTATFATRTLHDGPVRLIAPAGVTLEGAGLEPLGQEPQTKAAIYGVKEKSFTVSIKGSGALAAASGQASAGAAPASSDDSSSQIREVLPRVYDRLWIILGLGLAILGIGFVLQLRRTAPAARTSPAARATAPAAPRKDSKS